MAAASTSRSHAASEEEDSVAGDPPGKGPLAPRASFFCARPHPRGPGEYEDPLRGREEVIKAASPCLSFEPTSGTLE
jgi:hypothetical protein